MGLLHISDGKKNVEVTFETLTKSMKKWDFEVNKCIAFSSDGTATMIGKKSRTVNLF